MQLNDVPSFFKAQRACKTRKIQRHTKIKNTIENTKIATSN